MEIMVEMLVIAFDFIDEKGNSSINNHKKNNNYSILKSNTGKKPPAP